VGACRVVHHDRRARPHAVVEWRPDGTLGIATVRIPDGSWLTIEPRAGREAPWGVVDRLWHGRTPAAIGGEASALTTITAVDWHAVRTIPTAAEPARLPAGAGSAVLNLLATLAREQGTRALRYEGPYPTEALFLALLECFQPDPAADDLLQRFADGVLAWLPAPFTPSFEDEAYVQSRAGIDKVVWRGRAYYRELWGPVRRRAHLRVVDAEEGARCVLWALGEALEDHLVVGPDGIPHVVAPAPLAAPVAPMSRPVRDGLVAAVVAMSAPPLATAIREVSAALAFTWGPVPLDLARLEGDEARVSSRLHAAFRRRRDLETGREGKARLALAALADVAGAIGDPLRARAQGRLAAAGAEAQARALDRGERDPDAARRITAAAAALVASGGVDDEPDVEGDEPGHGDD
jgi:hypothetical protein